VRQLGVNTFISFGTVVLAIGPAILLSIVLDGRQTLTWLRTLVQSRMGVFWALWILPAFVFLWLVDSTEPGHDLIFIGALVALGAGLLSSTATTRLRLALGAAVVIGVQTAVFLLAAPMEGRPLAATLDSMLLDVTATGFRHQQAALDDALHIIRGRFDPGDTTIVTLVGEDPNRFMTYYLPEYTVVRLDPYTHSQLIAYQGTKGHWAEVTGCLFDASLVRHAVWVVSRPEPGTIPEGAIRVSNDSSLFQVWQLDLSGKTTDYLGFTIC
jgi:hypothetical protein